MTWGSSPADIQVVECTSGAKKSVTSTLKYPEGARSVTVSVQVSGSDATRATSVSSRMQGAWAC